MNEWPQLWRDSSKAFANGVPTKAVPLIVYILIKQAINYRWESYENENMKLMNCCRCELCLSSLSRYSTPFVLLRCCYKSSYGRYTNDGQTTTHRKPNSHLLSAALLLFKAFGLTRRSKNCWDEKAFLPLSLRYVILPSSAQFFSIFIRLFFYAMYTRSPCTHRKWWRRRGKTAPPTAHWTEIKT